MISTINYSLVVVSIYLGDDVGMLLLLMLAEAGDAFDDHLQD